MNLLITETGYHHLKPEKYYLDTIGGIGIKTVLSPEEKQQAEQDYADNLTNYNNVKALYDNLKDGGNTDGTVSDVETAWPDEMWELRAELLGKSPHLSKEVLMAAADKTDVLPESVLFEILAANPDELDKYELIDYLRTKEQPLPEYMIEILQQLTGTVTYKTILKRQMAKYFAKKTDAANDIIRSTLSDTIMNSQLYREWLDNLGGIEADKQIIASYFSENDFNQMQALLNIIPSLYNLEESDLLAYNEYKSLIEMQMEWKQQGKSIFNLDSTDITILQEHAENSVGTAKSIARNILSYYYETNYCDCLITDSLNMKKGWAEDEDVLLNYFGPNITIKPNPAHNWTTFNYKLLDDLSEGIIEISSSTGMVIKLYNVKGKQGQIIWDTRSVKPGIYLITIKSKGTSQSVKAVVTK